MTVSVSATPKTPQGLPIHWQLSGALHPGEPSQDVNLNAARFRVGRRPGLNLTLPSMQVSMIHAEFVQLGGRIFVRDLNSTNGTYVNGARIDNRDVALRDGDRIRIGTVELRLMRRWNDGDTSETAMLGDTAQPFKLDDPDESESEPGKTHIAEHLNLPPISMAPWRRPT
jgi:pSer/pThr/pTyr-binding forkhead associated (FHA) protein